MTDQSKPPDRWQIRAEEAEAMLAEARKQVERWRHPPRPRRDRPPMTDQAAAMLGDLQGLSPILPARAVAERLRRIRLVRGLTVQAVADATGIDRAVLAKIELGKRKTFNLDEARLISEALHVDLREVISDEPMTITTAVHIV